ncbi:response regulator transcription factor [Sphingobacterium haloxyli]|uniref:DNA-binding response regulator n=1 Tax=Sphingobacterium haloxyli TaxID=2100533 RepID=A0A2S9J8K3_9SPHI|nr:response regulator transcription factor [Sphingobacterium haloxyli]PRD49101.1 DNA-binding response regulator [Sphingobacterium haloxyli]
MKGKLLLIEDNQDLGQEVKNYLNAVGFTTRLVPSSFGAIESCKAEDFDLLIIDIQLPGMDGFELIEDIRKIKSSVDFLFLTARNQRQTRLRGLKLGAADYITKPFDAEELVWRIHNILNRNSGEATRGELRLGDVVLDRNTMRLTIGGQKQYRLTTREFELWEFLLAHENTVLKRSDILIEIWGNDDYFLGRSLDVFISRIRKILRFSESVELETVFKVGFIMKARSF